MPNSDGTGPRRKGPTTGCSRGYCVLPISTPEQELDFLKDETRALRRTLEGIDSRIKGLAGEGK